MCGRQNIADGRSGQGRPGTGKAMIRWRNLKVCAGSMEEEAEQGKDFRVPAGANGTPQSLSKRFLFLIKQAL